VWTEVVVVRLEVVVKEVMKEVHLEMGVKEVV
jgi:hypothetical protein